jgi:hypothetical protein
MVAGLDERQVSAARILQRTEASSCRTRNATHCVATVTFISDAGMTRQHAHGNLFRAYSSWERSMPFKKPLPNDDRSLPTLVRDRDARILSLSSRPAATEAGITFVGRFMAPSQRIRSYQVRRPRAENRLLGDESAFRTSSKMDAPWHRIPAAVFGLMANAFEHLAVYGEAGVLHMLFAVGSWIVAQALAGCLAYAEAMYSVELSGPIDCRDSFGNSPPDCEDRDQILDVASYPRTPDDPTLKIVGLPRCDLESRRGARRE